jgi:hypothetical protein
MESKLTIIFLLLLNNSINSCYNLQKFNTTNSMYSEHNDTQYLKIELVNNLHSDLISLIKPKLRVYLRELKDNSLLFLIFIEPQHVKEIIILEYTVNYLNKINNQELMNIEFNNDLSERLLVEIKGLNHNTPYKICIEATLQFYCNISNTSDSNENIQSLLNQYCNLNKSKILNEQKITIRNCIDNIITQKSVSLQALTSSLGALISLISIMTCIYSVQSCKNGTKFKIFRFKKPLVEDVI